MTPSAASLDYPAVLIEFLRTMALILGPSVVVTKTRSITGLSVNPDGTLKKYEGDAQKILQEAAQSLMPLSDYTVRSTLNKILSTHAEKSGVAGLDFSRNLKSDQTKAFHTLHPVSSSPKHS